MNCYSSPAKSTKVMHPQNRYWQNYEMPDVRNTIDFWEKDAENDNCRKNLRRGYNFHENSTDKKISEYSEMYKRFTINDEDTAQRSKFSKNFSGIRPFDEFTESFQTEERIASPSNYKPPLGRGRGNQNSRGRGVSSNPRQGFQLNWNTRYKWFRKPPVDRETDGERDDFTAYLSTNQKARGFSQSEPYKREFNENSLVNTIYGNRDGNRKRHFTSQGIYPYKFKNTRSNSRTPERYKSRSRSQSQSRYRRSRERSSSRYYTSRSPSSSRSRSSSRRGGYRSPSQRDAKHYSRSYDQGQTHSYVNSRSYEQKSESYGRKSRGSFRGRNYRSKSSSFSRSRSSSRNSRSSSRGHHNSNRGYHRSRGYSRSYSRGSSRDSRYSFRSRSQSSSRDRRYRSHSYRSNSRNRAYRSQSLSRSRSRSGSRSRYRSKSSETSGSYRSQSPPRRIAGSPKKNSDYESQSYSEGQWNDETIRSRNRSPSYSSVENRKLRRRDSVDSLSSITSTESNSSSSRSRSRSSERGRNRKLGKRNRKYTPPPSKNKNKSDKMSGKFRNPSRNEAIVRKQFERYEEENEEKMLASVDDLLGKLVGSVTEHSHFEPVNEPVIPQDTTSREHESRAQETEYRTIQVKPKSPTKPQQMSDKSSTHEGSSHSSSKDQETLRISVTSNEERNVICEKETDIIETCSARKRKHLSEDVNNRNTQDLSPSVKKCKRNISQLMTDQKIVAESGLSNQVHASSISLKTSEDTKEKQDPKQDSSVKVAKGKSATLVPNMFTEMPKKPNPQVATIKLNDQNLAKHEMEAKFKRNAIMPKSLIKSPKRKEFANQVANQESVEQSIELSINISKQQLSPLFLKTVSIKSKCEKNMNSPNSSEMRTEKVQTKESENTAEGSPESSIKPVRKDSSDLELASFDEFTDSEQDSGSKSSSETENMNSQDRIQQKLMEPPSDFTNVDVIPEYIEEKSVSETEKSVIKSHKELSSQNSFEVDYDGIVKTSTPIRNVLDNVSNKNTVQECSGEAVKKNLFEVISKESDGKDNCGTQQKENIELMSKKSAKSAVNQTDQNLKEKCHQKISNEKRPNSDRNSQVAKSSKVGKEIHTNKTDTFQKKCSTSIKQTKGVDLKDAERNALKEQPKPKMKSIAKDKEKKTLKEKNTQSSDRKISEDAKKLKYKLKDVSLDIKLINKKTDNSKEQKSGEFSEENNISNDSMQSTFDETLPKLVSRKDKRRDSSTTSIESSDRETSIPKNNKRIATKERINPKQKPYKQNEMSSSKSGKEDKDMERKHVGSFKLKTGTSKTEKMRPQGQTASKIKLIEQEDIFMPSTPLKTKHTGSKKDKVNKLDSQVRTDGPKKMSAAKTTVKGPTNKVSNSRSINEKPKVTAKTTSEEIIQSENSDSGLRSTTDVSSSSEMETDGVVPFTQDAIKNREKDTIVKTVSTENEVDGNSTSGEEIDVAKISLSGARRQSRAISKEHLKVLEKNKEVRNRTCLELKQGQIGGRKMSKSGKIQKLKHKAHAEILHGNPLMKPATKTIQDKDKEKRKMLLHASAQKTNQPGTAEFKKPTSGIKHNETDIIAKNILQKVPGKIEIYDASFKKVTYDSSKTTTNARANESLKSSNDTDEAQTTDVSLQEYRNLHEDLDLSSDDEQLPIDLDKPKSKTEKASCEKDKHNLDKQEEIKDMLKRSEIEKGKMGEKEESIQESRENMQEKQEQTPDVNSNEELIHGKQCETTKTTSRSQNRVAESKENEAGQSESDKNRVKSTLEETPKESKTSEEKMLSSDSSKTLMDSILLSPANPTATIPEDQVDYSDIRIMYYDHGVPQSPYIAEEDIVNAKTFGKIQNQEEVIPSSRPETPSLNISPQKDQTARKILPEEDFPMLSTAVSPVEENLANAQNVSNSQETEASSDYGTDSNRGTPLSVISEPSEEVEHQNPVNRKKKFSSKEETVLSGPEKPKLNAIDILEKQSDNPHLQKFLSELRQESSNYHQTICFTHRKSFKNLITANGDDNLTVGFLELQKLREPKLKCIKCNVCKMYLDPCGFLLHFDVKDVKLDETKCLLTEPMHAMPKMDPNVQRIWEKFITLKNVLVNATLSFSSLGFEKDQLDRYKRPSDSQGINQNQSLISPVIPNMMGLPTTSREVAQTNTNQTSSSNTDSLLAFIGTNLVFVQRQHAVQVAATIIPAMPVNVNAVPQNPNLSQQSQNFTSPTNPATSASMSICRQVDRRKSLESSAQNSNMISTGARNTRSLSDKGMETQNYMQYRQTRLRHQSSASEQQVMKNAQMSATMPPNSMLVRDYRMVGVPGQNTQMITPQQGLVNPCRYQTTQEMNSRDPLNACQTEANTMRSMIVPQTQPPPYPGTSVNHQSSRYNILPNSRQNCMLQQQPAASQVQQSAMNHSQQQIHSNVHVGPVPPAHQQNMPVNRQDFPPTMIPSAHQNMFVSKQQSLNNQGTLNMHPNRNSLIANPQACTSSTVNQAHPMFPTAYLNMPANQASSSMMAQSHANMPSTQAPLSVIPPAHQNMGYRNGTCMVPPGHQPVSTTVWSNQYQQPSMQSVLSVQSSLKPNHLQPTSGTSSLQSNSGTSSQRLGNEQIMHSVRPSTNFHQSSNGQNCSSNQTNISRQPHVDQHPMNQTAPTAQTRSGESAVIPRVIASESIQPGNQFNHVHIADGKVSSFDPNSINSDITNPTYSNSSLSNPNQRLQVLDNVNKPNRDAVEVLKGNEVTRAETQSANNESQRTSVNVLRTATGVAQTIHTPADAQRRMVSSCVNMVASIMWMYDELKQKTADVVSAQQELQQWKDEIKKTVDEYHTTEGVMTQKIQEVLSRMTN